MELQALELIRSVGTGLLQGPMFLWSQSMGPTVLMLSAAPPGAEVLVDSDSQEAKTNTAVAQRQLQAGKREERAF